MYKSVWSHQKEDIRKYNRKLFERYFATIYDTFLLQNVVVFGVSIIVLLCIYVYIIYRVSYIVYKCVCALWPKVTLLYMV